MIVCENVSKYYGRHAAVANLSFAVPEGQVVGLLGLNGAGKTTTLRILSGLLVPSAGRVEIAGVNLAAEPEAARSRLGFLPETPPLYVDMTVTGYLAFVARIKGLRGDLSSHLSAAMAATDLLEVQDEVISTLSHGYQRRVGIAQAIVNKPDLILLDEPTGGLDPVQMVHMRALINALRGKNTILVSSHQLGEIHALCDRIFVMHEGRIAAEGSEEELARSVVSTTKVQLEVRGDSATLHRALDAHFPAWRLKIEREAHELVCATVEMQDDQREALAQAVCAAGLGLRQLTRVAVGLESIFMRLTGSPPQP